jgi:23S rRNA (uracil1939-C5)-methyltransferase
MPDESGPPSFSVRIEKIVYPGRSLAGHRGKVVFTDEGLPGELVEVTVTKERPNYLEARTVLVQEASPQRRPARCDHYRACSPYQVIDYPLQTELKTGQVQDLLGRQLGVEPGAMAVKPSPEIWGYRNKARFHLIGREGHLAPAYHEPDSTRSYVPVGTCHLISERMNGLLASALELLNAAKVTAVKEVEVKETADGGEMLLILAGKKFTRAAVPATLGPKLKKLFPLCGLIWLTETGERTAEVILHGRDFLQERAGGLAYRIGARSFFQVNRFMLEETLGLIRTAAREAGARRIADLYCGLGTFGLALAAGAEEVWGVESDPGNIAFLEQNVRLNKADNFHLGRGTTEEWAGRILAGKPDLVIVDPPRKGLGPRVVGPILKSPPPWLFYLSCDPATLARDLKSLLTRYKLERLWLLDFFPHTPHIETLSLLARS